MRIGIEAQRIFRANKHGMDNAAVSVINALALVDKRNLYFIFVNDGPDKDCLELPDNFTVVCKKASYASFEQFHLPKLVAKYKLDLLHCTGNTAPIRCTVPVVLTLHDLIFFEKNPLFAQGYSYYQRFGNYYRRRVISAVLKKLRKIITVSNFERNRILGLFPHLNSNDVRVIGNAAGSHFMPERSEENTSTKLRDKYGLPAEYGLFLGNTDPKKNTRDTLRSWQMACKQMKKDIPLVIGDIDQQEAKSRMRFSDADLQTMRFPGYIDNRDLPAVMAEARIFLYTSRRESFGIPILEAMASATPVVTANVTSMPEVAGDAAYLVDPYDVSSMADGIQRVLADEALAKELVEKGFERIQSFSWERSARELLDVYAEVCA